jgi:GT2 family glycosyltransferase
MEITVIVGTYRRPEHLQRCLDALKKQIRSPDEVLIMVRDTDAETPQLLESVDLGNLKLRTIQVQVPGLVAARNAGMDAAKGDIIVFVDDDAAPHPDWLTGIEAHFREDPKIGGVGGRDWVRNHGQVEDGARKVVGKVQWFGRVISNNHLGVGGPREVDVLKGVNMSYRRTAIQGIRFDERLRGIGAQAADDWAFSLAVKRAGWKIVYDPAVAVDHYAGTRLSKDFRPSDIIGQRQMFDAMALSDHVHNETLVVLMHLHPLQRVVFVIWAVLVGTRDAFGLVQWLRFLPREGSLSGEKLLSSLKGRIDGWRSWRCRDV